MLTKLLTPVEGRPVVLHQGVYKPTATTAEAVFMITGMTIGAGILGLPYAVARVGILVGVAYILFFGLLTLALNLMIGEIAVKTGENAQLAGLAGRHLGKFAKAIVSLTSILRSYGALLAYLVGAGLALAGIFGRDPLGWSVIFWSIGSFLIWGGLQRIKIVEKIFSLAVMIIIGGLSLALLPLWRHSAGVPVSIGSLFLPIGIILFALHATPAIAEAHALLPGSERRFRRAIIIGTLVPIGIYLLFTIAVVGALGRSVSEVATVSLGERFGPLANILTNVFALLAMTTGFMGLGTALKETFIWDLKIKPWPAKFLVIMAPLLLYLAGLKNFIRILEVVGGLFITIEALIMIMVYLRVRRPLPKIGVGAIISK